MFTSIILSVIVATIVLMICMLIYQYTGKQQNVRERMQRIVGSPPAAPLGSEDAANEALHSEQFLSPLGDTCESILKLCGVKVDEFRKESMLRFYRAGLSSPDAPVLFLFFKYVISGLFLVVAAMFVFSQAEGIQRMFHYMVALFLIIISIFGSDLFVENQRKKREKRLQLSFPDTLDLLLVCVESGLALDGALARVCKELGSAYPEITMELNRTRLELTLLNDRSQALSNLAERTDMLTFRTLVTTLLQSERFGTGLTDTLRVLSEDYRNTRLMMAENAAGRLPVLMTIPMITLMLPALFMVILAPAILKTLETLANQQ